MLSTRDVAPGAIKEILRRQPVSPGKVQFAWESAVGPSVARATSAELDASATLHVTVHTESWRSEIVRSKPLIIRRMAELLGSDTVKRIAVRRRETS